jgi:hypothetical protein
MKKFLHWIYRLWFITLVQSGFYGWISRVKQALFEFGGEWEVSGRPVNNHLYLADVDTIMSKIEYHKDPLGGSLDTFKHPCVAQGHILKKLGLQGFAHVRREDVARLKEMNTLDLHQSFDCDDFAILAASILPWRYSASVLTVMWREKYKCTGHNICLFRQHGSVQGHLGNWGIHELPGGKLNTTRDAAQHVITLLRRAGRNPILVGYKDWKPSQVCHKWD